MLKKSEKKIIIKTITNDKMEGVEYHKNKQEFEKKRNINHKFFFKTSAKLFTSCENLDSYLRLLKLDSNKTKIFENYEIIYSDNPVPLYLDIDYKNNDQDDITLLDTTIYYLAMFMKEHGLIEFEHENEKMGYELMSKFSITSATREVEINYIKYIKHSYHLILRRPYIHFKNQAQILIFLNRFKEWLKQNADEADKSSLVHSDIGQKPDYIFDESIYSRNPGKLTSLRTIDSHKGDGSIAEVLKKWTHPMLGGGQLGGVNEIKYQTKDYYVNYIHSKSVAIRLPDNWDFDKTSTKLCESCPVTQGLDKAPIYIENKVLGILRNKFNNYNLINTEQQDGIFYFNFETDEDCLICRCKHERMSNNTRYCIKYNTHNANITYYCKKTKKSLKFDFTLEDNLLVPDYTYDDTEEINCKPLISLDKLGVDGTFLLESAKGTGKSEAISKFLSGVPEDKSILIISYRVSLINKYVEELKKFNIRHYQRGFEERKDFHRVAICKESLHKLFVDVIGKYRYDIVIIDEIYSVLESWDNRFRKDISDLMNIFDVVLRNAKYLYVMDAHLNNKLVVNTLKNIRKEEKFIFHKNPRLYDYSDYNVHWFENHDIDAYRGFQNMIIQDLLENKKVAVISSTKSYVDETYTAIVKHGDIPSDLEVFKYTSSPDDEDIKNEHFKNVEKYWTKKCVVLYSPTISAGISFNKIGFEGFDKLYVYLTPINEMTASINTFGQMIFRVRQLNKKKINIFFDTKKYAKYEIEEHQIEKRLNQRCSLLTREFGLPLKNNGICLETLRPLYDREHWSYTVWFETAKNKIRYNKPLNFKDYFRNLLCNKPSDKFPGRGMKFIDCSNQIITLEEEEKTYLDKIITNDKKDKLDDSFQRFYLNPDDKNRQYLTNVYGKSILEFNKLCEYLVKKAKLSDEEEKEYEKVKKFWKIIMGIGYQTRYRRYKNWINNSNDEQFTKLFRNYMKDSTSSVLFWDEEAKVMNVEYDNKIKPIVVEGLVNRGYHLTSIMNDICQMFELPLNTNLNGLIIKREKFEEILSNRKQVVDLIHRVKQKTKIFKDVKRNLNLVIRKRIQEWQLAHPNTCVYDLNEEEVKTFFKFTGANKTFQGFKPSDFRNGVVKKDEKIKEFAEGRWSYSDWKKNDPEEFTTETFKNAISKIMTTVLNFKLEKVRIGSSYQWAEQCICNVFVSDGLIEI